MGGMSILRHFRLPDRLHYHSRIFFCPAAVFGRRDLAGIVEALDLEPKKTSPCQTVTDMVQLEVG